MNRRTIQKMLHTAPSGIPALDAEVLLAHVLGRPREWVITHPAYRVSLAGRIRYQRLISKRRRGLPLAYLTGHKEFFGLNFLVSNHTLIPRPETELLAEAAINELQGTNNTPALVDVGTGTGCIPIAIWKTVKNKPTQTFAIDISRPALRIAQKNAGRHMAAVTFLHGNLLEPFLKIHTPHMPSRILITANLPYLTQGQFDDEPSIQHEPKRALIAENGGLALYEKLLQQIKILKTKNYTLTTFFEIDPSQAVRLSGLITHIFPAAHIEIKKDLGGRDRLVVADLS